MTSNVSSDAGSAAPPLVLLVGPTASGKTDVSLCLARALNAEIVACDSRQLYRGLDLGTGKPAGPALARVRHHMLDRLDPRAVANAARYEREARQIIGDIHARGRRVLVVGGSGLYVRALLEGIFDGPGRNEELRDQIRARAEREGWGALHAELFDRDPETAERVHPNDGIRITRALEIIDATGEPVRRAQARAGHEPIETPWRAFGIDWPRGILRQRISDRFRIMVADGLVDEVNSLLASGVPPNAPAFRSPGYREIVSHLSGEMSLEEAMERGSIATAQYAKRQHTWFRKMEALEWVPGEDNARTVSDTILERLAS